MNVSLAEKTEYTIKEPQRKAWFLKEVMVKHVPQEMLPGDLIAGARFNVITSTCFTKKERESYDKRVVGKKGARAEMKWFHDPGYGNAGATSGHLIPGYERALKIGWKGIYESLESSYNQLDPQNQKGQKGSQLKAMMTAATLPGDLAEQYTRLCAQLATEETDPERATELSEMARNLATVPWEPAGTFWDGEIALSRQGMLRQTMLLQILRHHLIAPIQDRIDLHGLRLLLRKGAIRAGARLGAPKPTQPHTGSKFLEGPIHWLNLIQARIAIESLTPLLPKLPVERFLTSRRHPWPIDLDRDPNEFLQLLGIAVGLLKEIARIDEDHRDTRGMLLDEMQHDRRLQSEATCRHDLAGITLRKQRQALPGLKRSKVQRKRDRRRDGRRG